MGIFGKKKVEENIAKVGEEAVVANEQVDIDAVLESTKETGEQTMEFKSVEELAEHLIANGVEPTVAVRTAVTQFGVVEPEIEVPVAKGTAAPVAPEAPKAEVKSEREVKGWFKSAVHRLSCSSRDVLIGNLLLEAEEAKTEEERAEIERFIDRLEEEEGFYQAKVEPMVIKLRGWSVDASGKVANGLYLTGEYANKGASGLTKAVGKGTQLVGKGIVKTGEFVEGQSENVGKVVEAPFKLAGDTINVLNGTKEMPTPKQN